MKPATILTFIAAVVAIPGLSSVQIWLASFQQPISNLIDNPRRKSTIPQFILDTNHPWILTNQRKLESLPNAKDFLCLNPTQTPKNEPSAPKTELEVPPDLFDNLTIDNNRYGISRPGWPNAIERLTEIKNCPRALASAKSLYIDIYVHSGPYSDLWLRALEPSQPPPEVAILFGDVLEALPSLNHLYWGIHNEYAHFFEESFKSRTLTLPSVKSLRTGPFSQYLVGMCPTLERLENGVIQSGAMAPKLKHFSMDSDYEGWSPDMAAEVVKFMPHIESLGLGGSIKVERTWDKTDDLKNILATLSALKNLTHIDLPYSGSLSLGFDGGAWCGNAYFGKSGREYGRQVLRQGAETTEIAAGIVLANLPNITSFTIGERAANITRGDDGSVSVTWPWTGRMDDWCMEMEPEPEGTDYDELEYGGMEDAYIADLQKR
ncbi:hypothetical protein ONS95_012875 [Cadophora gregata]|uniref:uncharacterized protein n=1 Tax=Cadophora gregata TaxID=51156 RepID=UPI0026DA78BD|nr:uncharacterized protein ONS95_012875 [Cadophora gregata]KAK0115824.1 hypothetical protein ONS95_012875 [Cadophora gregata]